MTILESFAQLMADNGFGVLGTDLFLGSAPNEPTSLWWIVALGGTPTVRADTGEKIKEYILTVFYRNNDAQDVNQRLQELEEFLNNKDCKDLSGYDTLDIEASGFFTDNDLDLEDRALGSIEVTAKVYQSS